MLLSFSDGITATGSVPSSHIFRELLADCVWYVPRASRFLLKNETTVVFYQSGSGIRGYALVLDTTDPTDAERDNLHRKYGLSRILVKLRLGNIQIFPQPVAIAPLVQDLHFVTNKLHWGHSVRTSPRTINDADFDLIKRVAAASTAPLPNDGPL